MGMCLVLLIAFHAESEIVALETVEVELSDGNRLSTLITGIPHIESIFSHLIIQILNGVLFHGLCKLHLIILLVFRVVLLLIKLLILQQLRIQMLGLLRLLRILILILVILLVEYFLEAFVIQIGNKVGL